jgi:integrase
LQSILAPWRKPTEPLSPVLGPCEPHHAQKFMARLSGGLTRPFTFHDLRKTFAGLLAEQGVPTTRIRDYLGHSSVATTETYYVARNRAAVKGDAEGLRFGMGGTETKQRKQGVA